jgi:hypothetical protein
MIYSDLTAILRDDPWPLATGMRDHDHEEVNVTPGEHPGLGFARLARCTP